MRFFILGALALAACANGGNNCDNCNAEVDDTGDPAEMSYVEVQVFVPTQDDIVSCHAALTGPPDYSFDTMAENGDPVVMSVQTGTYSVEVGDADHLTSYGAPIHTAADGSLSIAPEGASAVVKAATESAPQVIVVDNLPYFRGTYSCNIVVFDYDESSADHKSGTGRSLGAITYPVEVQADGKVESSNGSEFGVLPASSYFLVTPGNEISVVVTADHEDDGISVSSSQITATSFAASVINVSFATVEDLTCHQ